jgi:hypothetical protein
MFLYIDKLEIHGMSKTIKKKKETFCSNCGASLRSGARFCSECGSQAGASESSTDEEQKVISAGSTFGASANTILQQTAKKTHPAYGTLFQGLGAEMGVSTPGEADFQRAFTSAQKAAERSDRVAAVAKWTGAVRQLKIHNDPAIFAGTIREILDIVEPFNVERDQFQNIMFVNLLTIANEQSLVPAINSALTLFPNRFKPFINNPNRIKTLNVGGPWKEIFKSWPYSIYQSSWDIPDDQLGEICVQTVYEGSIMLNLAPNGFLEDEQIRIDAGLYPSSFKPLIQRACSKCHSAYPEAWGDTTDQKAETFLMLYSPFAHPKTYSELQVNLAQGGMSLSFPQEKLSDWELQTVHSFIKDQSYNRQDVLSMLINRWESFTNQITQLIDALRLLYIPQHTQLSLCLNMHSRRADPQHHQDYGNFLGSDGLLGNSFVAMLRKNMEEKGPHLVRCFWPTIESLYLFEYRIRRKLEMQGTPNPQETETEPETLTLIVPKGKTQKDDGSIPPAPEGRGPGKKLPWGEIYYPMLPEIPLTEDGVNIRQQGLDLIYKMSGSEPYPGAWDPIYEKLRKIISKNLSSFGLTKNAYAKLDDNETLYQYLIDITDN